MLPGQHLVPGSAGAGNRQEEMPAWGRSQAREGWDVVATDFPSEPTGARPSLSFPQGPSAALGLGYCCDTLEPGCSLLTLPAPSSCVVLIRGWGVARKRGTHASNPSEGRVDTVKLGTLSRKRGTATSRAPGPGEPGPLCLVPPKTSFPHSSAHLLSLWWALLPSSGCSSLQPACCHPLNPRAHHQLPVVDSFCVCSHPSHH